MELAFWTAIIFRRFIMEDKEIQIAGTLYWQDFELDLVDPFPEMEREHWMTDNFAKFKVIQGGKIFDVIVSRPFMVSRKHMGERVPLKVKEMTKEELITFESIFADEPVSLLED